MPFDESWEEKKKIRHFVTKVSRMEEGGRKLDFSFVLGLINGKSEVK